MGNSSKRYLADSSGIIVMLISLSDLESIQEHAAILVDTNRINLSQALHNIFKKKPKFICFFGQNAEFWHDKYDELCLNQESPPLTTWETTGWEETLRMFLETDVPLNAGAAEAYVITNCEAEP